jgi:very-short-patch-repair endonuclease/DNA-directed RNA polymerase subunit RPC12/RpoP
MKAKEQEIIKRFTNKGYEVTGIFRRNDKEIVVNFVCPHNHKHFITWGAWKRSGQRCGKCFGNKGKITFEKVKDSVETEGYVVLSSQYIDQTTPIEYKCPKQHKSVTSWKYWQRGVRCPYCLNKSEHKLGEILEQIYPGRIKKQGNLGFLGRQRVDYYIEKEKIAIEYDGEQHHKPIIGAFGAKTEEEAQEQLRKTQKRDKRKEQLCKENGWRLIRIRYDEPLDKQHLLQRII